MWQDEIVRRGEVNLVPVHGAPMCKEADDLDSLDGGWEVHLTLRDYAHTHTHIYSTCIQNKYTSTMYVHFYIYTYMKQRRMSSSSF